MSPQGFKDVMDLVKDIEETPVKKEYVRPNPETKDIRSYKCKFCEFGHARKMAVAVHIKKAHPDKIPPRVSEVSTPADEKEEQKSKPEEVETKPPVEKHTLEFQPLSKPVELKPETSPQSSATSNMDDDLSQNDDWLGWFTEDDDE